MAALDVGRQYQHKVIGRFDGLADLPLIDVFPCRVPHNKLPVFNLPMALKIAPLFVCLYAECEKQQMTSLVLRLFCFASFSSLCFR